MADENRIEKTPKPRAAADGGSSAATTPPAAEGGAGKEENLTVKAPDSD